METKSPPIRNARCGALVDEATRLQRVIRENEAQLNELKLLLRKEAEKVAKRRDSDELVEFEGAEGTATVCFVKDTVGLVKGADPKTLRDVLSEDAWDSLFQLKVVMVPEFEDRLWLLPKRIQKRVGDLIRWSQNAPRVILPK